MKGVRTPFRSSCGPRKRARKGGAIVQALVIFCVAESDECNDPVASGKALQLTHLRAGLKTVLGRYVPYLVRSLLPRVGSRIGCVSPEKLAGVAQARAVPMHSN